MHIAVLGANGKTGRIFVAQALAAGHTISAGIHSFNTLAPHPNLTVCPCDALNPAAVRQLITGSEAVVSFLGHGRHTPPHLQTEAMHLLSSIMPEFAMQRVVSLTGTGVRFPGDKIGLFDRLLNFSIGHIDPARILDGKQHVEALQASGLEWTILRVLKLTDGLAKPYALLPNGPGKWFVSRQETAQAVLKVLTDHSYLQQAPVIGPSTT